MVVHMPTPTSALRTLLRDLPVGNVLQLAKAAGVPHSTLFRIKSGKLNASDEVAVAVAEALDGWARDTSTAARAIRAALREWRD
jgi:predicted transcriptional regulator